MREPSVESQPAAVAQEKQPEWLYQWERFRDTDEFLFWDWVQPRTLADFEGKRVLDAGCGPGHHVRIVAPVAAEVVGLDLNAHELARGNLAHLPNVSVHEGDLARWTPDEPFDVVYSIGTIDHTDDPDASMAHLASLLRPGGLLIAWVWSREGNTFMAAVVEPLRRLLLRRRGRRTVERLARILTAMLYPVVHTVYRLPLRFLPYHDYFANFRRLTFDRNALNVFDKLNAPYTELISNERARAWFPEAEFEDVRVVPYKGISWCVSGRKR
ncbi:class I SAM-dependent methyltransferase [Phytohabitans flavus]|uniref:class I SAM-dependent methyltransferase n=1 Tax=Phytohabitans flavus TaxID=1076124 RepID=UPI001564DA95|nr:class I SAM-dependent methyltransferase [Phytohabitans flavus]